VGTTVSVHLPPGRLVSARKVANKQ
jgi:hypothetical protein